MKTLTIALVAATLFIGPQAFAKGEGFSLGLNLGIATSSQSDMNLLIKNANTRTAGLAVSELGNAWEGNAMLSYRLSGSMMALQFRPGFFYQSTDGSAAGGTYEYSAIGFTVFPVLRIYMLEDNAIKFFSNFSVGWGMINGKIKEGVNEVKFSGGNLGYMVGLGAEFCFFGGSHCMNIEGNFRFLDIERVTADSVSGTFDGTGGTIDAVQKDGEVELGSRDLGVNMSGIVGLIGYIMYF